MKRVSWQLLLCIGLVVLSAFVYFMHYLIFHDVHHILIYLIGDIAFVFIEVLLVTLIIHQLLSEREKRSMLEKMNMVIGTFLARLEQLSSSLSPDSTRAMMKSGIIFLGQRVSLTRNS